MLGSIFNYMYYFFKAISRERNTIIIGIIGMLVSIIIFVGEFQRDKDNYRIEKKAFINYLNCLELFKNSLYILLYSWILNTIDNLDYQNSWLKYPFIGLELVELVFIIILCRKIYQLLRNTIFIYKEDENRKIIVKEYFINILNEYSNYMNNKGDIKQNITEIKELERNENYKEYFEINDYFNITQENYYQVESKKNGYIENIDIQKIKKIIDENKDKNQDKNQQFKIILNTLPGNKISTHDIVFSSNTKIDDNVLLNTIKIEYKYIKMETEINDDFNDLIKICNSNNEFDQDNYLKNIYDELLDNESDSIDYFYNIFKSNIKKSIALSNNLSKKMLYDINNKIDFLIVINKITLKKKKEKCKLINNMIYDICFDIFFKLNNIQELKSFSSHYAFHILNGLMNDYKESNNYELLTMILGKHLYLMANLIKEYKLEEAKIIVDIFYNHNMITDNLINYDMLIGYVKIYIALYNKNNTKNIRLNEMKYDLKEIFNIIRKNLFSNEIIPLEKIMKESIGYLKSENQINGYSSFIDKVILQEKYKNYYFGDTIKDEEVAFYSMIIMQEYIDFDIDINNCNEKKDFINLINSMTCFNYNEDITDIFGLSKDDIDNLKNELLEIRKRAFTNTNDKKKKNIIINTQSLGAKLNRKINIENDLKIKYVLIRKKKKTKKRTIIFLEEISKLNYNEYIEDDKKLNYYIKNYLMTNFNNYFNYHLLKAIDKNSIESLESLEKTIRRKEKEYIILADSHEYKILKNKYKNIEIYKIDYDYVTKGKMYLINKNEFPILELKENNDNDIIEVVVDDNIITIVIEFDIKIKKNKIIRFNKI